MNARLQREAVAGVIIMELDDEDGGSIKNFYQEIVTLDTCHWCHRVLCRGQ